MAAPRDTVEGANGPGNMKRKNVAVRCNVLQCVAVCCSVLQCVAVCCSVLQCVAVLAVCCSELQCVAVRPHTLKAPTALET